MKAPLMLLAIVLAGCDLFTPNGDPNDIEYRVRGNLVVSQLITRAGSVAYSNAEDPTSLTDQSRAEEGDTLGFAYFAVCDQPTCEGEAEIRAGGEAIAGRAIAESLTELGNPVRSVLLGVVARMGEGPHVIEYHISAPAGTTVFYSIAAGDLVQVAGDTVITKSLPAGAEALLHVEGEGETEADCGTFSIRLRDLGSLPLIGASFCGSPSGYYDLRAIVPD